MNLNTSNDRQRRRDQMTTDIVGRVLEAVKEELGDAPVSLSREEREAIESSVLAHTRLVVDALGTQEMQSERALLSHVSNARQETNRLIRERRPAEW